MAYTGFATTESFASVTDLIVFFGCLQGAGAAAPVVPATAISLTSAKGFMQATTNIISKVAGDTTRAGVGVYTTKFRNVAGTQTGLPAILLDVTVNVAGPNGTWGTWSDYNPTTGALSFLIFAAGGAAADLTSAEFVRFTFTCQNSAPAS